MIKLLLPTLFILASTTQTVEAAKVSKSATNTLEIKKQNNLVEIELPEIALKLLTQWNPEFIPFNLSDYGPSIIELFNDIDPKKVPMAFIDDLDGDHKNDIVLLGSDLTKQYVVALVNNNKKWTLVKVAEWSYKDIKNTSVPLLSDSSVTVSGTAKTTEKTVPLYILQALGEQAAKLKEKKKIGIQVEYYLGAGTVYEIKNNKAVKFRL